MPRSKSGLKRDLPSKELMISAAKEVYEGLLSVRKAADKYGVSKTTVARLAKSWKNAETPVGVYEQHYNHKQIFSVTEEAELVNYIVLSAKMHYGLSLKQVRKLAFKYAVANGKTIPENWRDEQMAGNNWMRGFRKRNPSLSLRTPEATSMGRSTAFNKTT